ncbi:streptophobe family protein [Lentzea sp. NEAU-D7]|uniref:streptophobe family protein n=1 Tax=Lentzea sp. NEAU-D7 TaxID=2994667 RepID=UPI00224A4DEB|nr:streptophobe family protein [Lentzea sp. NEAU-D7]MCX2946923.1 streptophobe family protein [Lentzea sp. NEAU-D7]
MAARRDVWRGVTAAAAALTAMGATAAAGLLLLDAGRFGGFGRLTAAVVAMAVGGSAEFGAVPSGGTPISVRGSVGVMPLGVALAGAVVLGWLLLRRWDGLLVRGAAAAVAFPAGAVAVALLARGDVRPPGGTAAGGISGVCGLPAIGPLGRGRSLDALGVGFTVPVWPVLAGAVAWVLVVGGVCWLVARFRFAVRGALWVAGGLAAACLLVAWAWGGPAAAGGVLFFLPHLVSGVLTLGLGVPWTVSADGALACVLDGAAPPAPGGPLTWVAAAVLLALGALAGRGGDPLRRAAWLGAAVGVALGGLALLSQVSVRLGIGAFGLSVPVLDAGLAANPLAALAFGSAGGAAAGLLAGGLLRLASVSWPAWRDRAR